MKTSSLLRYIVLLATIQCVTSDGLRGGQFHRDLQDNGGGLPEIDVAIPFCFSEKATVQVEGKGSVTMKDLAVGDSVLTGDNKFQPVYAFSHRHSTKPTDFVQIRTDTKDAPLELSGQHMLYVNGKTNPVRADSISVGDDLRGESKITSKKVTKIRSVQREGLYAPLTPAGKIVVDGILASNYISLQEGRDNVELQGEFSVMSQQRFAHMGLSPFRIMCMGISPELCKISNEEEGMPGYVSITLDLSKWVNDQHVVVQMFALAIFVLIFGASMLLESTFGASWVPSTLLATAGLLTIWKVNGRIGKSAKKLKTA